MELVALATLATLDDAVAGQVADAWAASTKDTYRSLYAGWLRFCGAHSFAVGVGDLSADVQALQRYLASRSDGSIRYATLKQIVKGVQHWLRCQYGTEVALTRTFPRLKWQLAGIRRQLGDSQVPKLGLSRRHLVDVISQLDAEWRTARLRGLHADAWRLACLAFGVLLCYFGMLRADELLSLRWGDLRVDWRANSGGGALWVQVRRSKTDQFGAGRATAVSLGDTGMMSPLLWWSRYERTPLTYDGALADVVAADAFVVRSSAARDSPAVSYGHWLKFLRGHMTRAGLPPAQVGSHSLRRGGASAAIASGVPLTSVMAMAGWRTFSSALLYTTADDEIIALASASLSNGVSSVGAARLSAAAAAGGPVQ